MKKVLLLLGACALLVALAMSGSSLLLLHTGAALNATVARLGSEAVPAKAEDLLPEVERSAPAMLVTPAAPELSRPAEPQESVAEFLFDQNNVLFESQEVFDLWDRMLDWTADEEARVRAVLAANAMIMSKLETLLPQRRANIRSLYAKTGVDKGPPDPFALNGRRWGPAVLLMGVEARLA
jgi:hypothetical protein